MKNKPEKIIHSKEKQEIIYRNVIEKIKEIFDSDKIIKEVRIYGSITKKTLGKYVETYKAGTPTARDASDIDIIFLIENIKKDKIILNSRYVLKKGRFIKDNKGKIVFVNEHPLMCANLTTPEDYKKNLNKPWPEGYDYTKNSKLLFERD